MDFPCFLLRKHWLSKDDYGRIATGVVKASKGNWEEGFLSPALSQIPDDSIEMLRPYPFGDVLSRSTDILENVLNRSGYTSFDAVVDCWQQWHVDNVEPISDFGLSPTSPRPFGKRLYDNYREKRNCGIAVAYSMIHDRDHVVIPEGTSAFWVGLAVLGKKPGIKIITSNGALVRELHENPKLRERASSVNVIGGELDVSVGGTGRGFVGDATQEAFENAVKREPGATVVVSSVNGLLADFGPYAPCPITSFTRHALLRQALDSNVRCVAFVADHTKMRPSFSDKYGDPIFTDRTGWQNVFTTYRDRIAFVVAPPEEIANSDVANIRPMERAIHGHGFSPPSLEYLRTAAIFDGAYHDSESHFWEAGLRTRTNRDMAGLVADA